MIHTPLGPVIGHDVGGGEARGEPPAPGGYDVKQISGGAVIQQRDSYQPR